MTRGNKFWPPDEERRCSARYHRGAQRRGASLGRGVFRGKGKPDCPWRFGPFVPTLGARAISAAGMSGGAGSR